MEQLTPTPPSFALTYWRPWNEESNFFNSYLDYIKDVSLAKYSADTIGKYIQQASDSQVQVLKGIENRIIQSNIETQRQLQSINIKLKVINRQLDTLSTNQQITNLLLNEIIKSLEIPNSEKERINHIQNGISFFLKGEYRPAFYSDALEEFLKAEAIFKQDYYVLYHLGLIYLYAEGFINPQKALDYFLKAEMYAITDDQKNSSYYFNILNKKKEKLHRPKFGYFVYNTESKIAYAVYNNISDCVSYKKMLKNQKIITKTETTISSLLKEKGIDYSNLIDRDFLPLEHIKEKSGAICIWSEEGIYEIKIRKDNNIVFDQLEKLAEDDSTITFRLKLHSKQEFDYLYKINSILVIRKTQQEKNISNNINILLSDIYQKLSFTSYITGQFQNAAEYQERAIERNESAENNFLLAKYSARIERNNTAIESLQKALQLDKDYYLIAFCDLDLISNAEVIKFLNLKSEIINNLLRINFEKLSLIDGIEKDFVNHLLKEAESAEIFNKAHLLDLTSLIISLNPIKDQNTELNELIEILNHSKFIDLTEIEKSDIKSKLIKVKNHSYEEKRAYILEVKKILDGKKITIGSYFQGGIVFYINEKENKGLICSKSSIGKSIWGNNENIHYDMHKTIGSGKNNTEIMLTKASFEEKKTLFGTKRKEIETAATICRDYEKDGYRDWFLPSPDELALIVVNLRGKNGFPLEDMKTYWTSYGSLDSAYALEYESTSLHQKPDIEAMFDNLTRRYYENYIVAVREF